MANTTSAKPAAPKKLPLDVAAERVRTKDPWSTAGMTDYQVIDKVARENPDIDVWGFIEGDWLSGMGKGMLEGSGIGAVTGMRPIQPNEGAAGPFLGRLVGGVVPLLYTGGVGAALKLPKALQVMGLIGTGAAQGYGSDLASQDEQSQRGVNTANPDRRAVMAALAGGAGAAIPASMGRNLLTKMAYGAGTGATLGSVMGFDDPEIGGSQGAVGGAIMGGAIGGAVGGPQAWRSRRTPAPTPVPPAATVPAADILGAKPRPAPGMESAVVSPLSAVTAPVGNPVNRALLHALLEDRAKSPRPEDILTRIDYLQDAIPVSLPQGEFQMAARLKRPEDVKAMGGRYLMQAPAGDIVPMRQGHIRAGTKIRNIQGTGVEVPPGWDIMFPTPLHKMGNEEYGIIGTQGRLSSEDLSGARALAVSGRAGQQAELPAASVPSLVSWVKAQEAINEANELSRRSLKGGKESISGTSGLPPPLQGRDTLSELEELVKQIREQQLRNRQGRLF